MEIDLTDQLQNELASRCAKNPKYSLRAFAKSLEVSPALLSLILSRKRAPSDRLKAKVRARVGLTGKNDNENTSIEDFEKINGVYAYGILGLIGTYDFKPSVSWISKRLGITIHEVRAIVSNLVQHRILDIESPKWKQLPPPIRLNNKNSSLSTRSFQKSLLEKAIFSLENDGVEIRDHSSITFCIRQKDVAAIKNEIREFRLRLSEKYEAKTKLTDVYNLTVQLVPLTRK